jgi:fidgetin-like protein 1
MINKQLIIYVIGPYFMHSPTLNVYIQSFQARVQILTNLLALKNVDHSLTLDQIDEIATKTEGFSGADMKTLSEEASFGPIRMVPFDQWGSLKTVRAISFEDFENALTRIRASVSPDDLAQYIKWNNTYGSGTANVK